EFRTRVTPLLMQDEARNNLMLGIGSALVEQPTRFPEFHLWVVQDGERAVLAALQTPPFNVVMSGPARPDALAALVAAIHEERPSIPGITGAVPEVDAFTEEWTGVTGARCTVSMEQGIYQLTAVRPTGGVAGGPREAGSEDRDLLVKWVQAFHDEADPEAPGDTARMVDDRLTAGSGLALWEVDGSSVSLAGYVGGTPNGVRVGPVYTPPELRGGG